MAERRVADVVAEPDRFHEILVQAQCAGDAAGDSGRLQRVREARPEVIAVGVDEDLGLVPKPAERLRVDDPVAVALERRAQPALVLSVRTAAALVRADGERGQPPLLVLAHGGREAVGHSPGELGHRVQRNGKERRSPRIGTKSALNRHTDATIFPLRSIPEGGG